MYARLPSVAAPVQFAGTRACSAEECAVRSSLEMANSLHADTGRDYEESCSIIGSFATRASWRSARDDV